LVTKSTGQALGGGKGKWRERMDAIIGVESDVEVVVE